MEWLVAIPVLVGLGGFLVLIVVVASAWSPTS